MFQALDGGWWRVESVGAITSLESEEIPKGTLHGSI